MSSPPAAATTPPPSASFARFLSSVRGHIVSRYGTATDSQAPAMIGASRTVTTEALGPHGMPRANAELAWDLECVVALTEAEARRFKREYDGHVSRRELRERKPEDFDRWLVLEAERATKAAAEAERRAAEATASALAKAKEDEATAKEEAAKLDASFEVASSGSPR